LFDSRLSDVGRSTFAFFTKPFDGEQFLGAVHDALVGAHNRFSRKATLDVTALSLDQGPIGRAHETCKIFSYSDKKNRKNYFMRESTLTLRQSGLLAVLQQWQRYKAFRLAQQRIHHDLRIQPVT